MPTKPQLVAEVAELKDKLKFKIGELKKANQELEWSVNDLHSSQVEVKGLNRAIGELQVEEDEWQEKLDDLEKEKNTEIVELKDIIIDLESQTPVDPEQNFIDDEILKKCFAIVIGFNKGQGDRMEFNNFLDLCIDRYKCLSPSL